MRQVLNYDPTTGIFVWKHRADGGQRWNTKNAGRVAGSPHNGGYLHIAIDGRKYLAHRLAWLYVHGRWPNGFLDHRNLNKQDNRIDNLRGASPLDNSANALLRSDNTTGFRGIYFWPERRRWYAKINRGGKTTYLGGFASADEASAAYAAAAIRFYGKFCPAYIRRVSRIVHAEAK